MKVSVEKSNLYKALGYIQNVVEKRNTIPILSHLLIETGDDKIILTATDLEMTLIQEIPAKINKIGDVTVSAHLLFDIVKKLSVETSIDFEFNEEISQLKLINGSSEFSLSSLPVDDYPMPDKGEYDVDFNIPASDLLFLLHHTKFAMSQEETRYYLNGIYIHQSSVDGASTIRAVATDGHRLARADRPIPDNAEKMPSVIIPKKLVNELSKIISNREIVIAISMSQNLIRLRFDDITVVSKLIDGSFPDYERVIPTGNKMEMKVNANILTQAVDLVSTVSLEKARSVKLSLSNDKLRLIVNNPDLGSAKEDITIIYAGEKLEIGFNSRYLMEVTNQIGDNDMRVLLADAGAPALIYDENEKDVLYVLMPLRI